MKKTLWLCGKFCSFPLVSTLAIVLLSGCGHENAKSRPAPTVPVQVATAVKQALPVTQKAIGSVQVLRGVAVKSQVDGIIQSIHFKEGDEVKAGDLLVTLDQRPYQNSLQMARADLVNAQAQAARAATDAERYARLDQASVVSKEQYAQLVTQAETTKAQVDAKVAAVANAQLQLDYTEIRAPIDGRTGQLGLHEGALVKANDAAFSLVTINDALLIVTPEYNYSIPGVLKNAMDWASRPNTENAFQGKPAAIMSASTGMLGGSRAQYHLRQTFVTLDIRPINKPEIMLAQAEQKFDSSGKLTDEKAKELIKLQLKTLVDWTWRLKAAQDKMNEMA